MERVQLQQLLAMTKTDIGVTVGGTLLSHNPAPQGGLRGWSPGALGTSAVPIMLQGPRMLQLWLWDLSPETLGQV